MNRFTKKNIADKEIHISEIPSSSLQRTLVLCSDEDEIDINSRVNEILNEDYDEMDFQKIREINQGKVSQVVNQSNDIENNNNK